MNWKNTLLSIVIAALVLGVACDRYIESNDPVRPYPDQGPVPTNLTAELIESAVVLTWQMPDPSGVLRYRVYTAPVDDSTTYVLRDSTTSTSITLLGLPPNQRYYFKVAAVAASGLEWDRSEAVSARVLHLSIAINGGAEYTSDRNVQVRANLPAGVATHALVSEDPLLAGSDYQLLSGTQTPYVLSTGDGIKRVYARLQFDDGTATAQTLVDSIYLDTYAKIDSVYFNSPGADGFFATGEVITFGLDAGEAGGSATVSFTGASGLVLFDNGTNGDPVANDGKYHYNWTVPLNFSLNNGVVLGSFTDRAVNRISQQSATRPLTVFATPLPVTLSVEALSDSVVELTWTRSVSGNFAAYRVYRGSNANVNLSSTLLTTLEGQATISYRDTSVAAATTYYYRVYVRDQSGLSAGSNVASATTPAGR